MDDIIDSVIAAFEYLKLKQCPECDGGGYTCFHCDDTGVIIDTSEAIAYLREQQYGQEL